MKSNINRFAVGAAATLALVVFAGCGKTRESVLIKATKKLNEATTLYTPAMAIVETGKDKQAMRDKLAQVVQDDKSLRKNTYPFMAYTHKIKHKRRKLFRQARNINAFEQINEQIQPSDRVLAEKIKDTCSTMFEVEEVLRTHSEYRNEKRICEIYPFWLFPRY